MQSCFNYSIIETNPLVSVIVPSYNHAKYITQCLESITNQTYRNYELTVIDDGSTDNSKEILEFLRTKYNFNLVFQENNGIAHTLNRGIQEFAKGKYIAFCASDDFWPLDKLEKQVDFMEKNRFYPLCYGNAYYVNENSEILKNQNINNSVLHGGWLFDDIFLFKIHPPVNYMYRTSIFSEVGYFDKDYIAEDYYMNLLISSKYCIGYIDEYLSYYRYSELNSKAISFDKVANSHLKAIELFKHHKLYNKAKRFVHLRKFEMFSPYKKLKHLALHNLLKSVSLCYKMQFLKATVKLLLFWK